MRFMSRAPVLTMGAKVFHSASVSSAEKTHPIYSNRYGRRLVYSPDVAPILPLFGLDDLTIRQRIGLKSSSRKPNTLGDWQLVPGASQKSNAGGRQTFRP